MHASILSIFIPIVGIIPNFYIVIISFLLKVLDFVFLSELSNRYITDNFNNLLSNSNKIIVNYTLSLLMYMVVLSTVGIDNRKLVLYPILLVFNPLILTMVGDYKASELFSKRLITTIELSLLNGTLNIHPVLLGFSYVGILVLLFINLSQGKLPVRHTKKLSNRNSVNKLSISVTYMLRGYGFFTLNILLLSIALGAYWSYQEMNWGGYWSWDPVEVFSLFSMFVIVFTTHSVKLKQPWSWYVSYVLFIITLIHLTRTNVLNSIHGFLSSQESLFRLNYTFGTLLVLLMFLLFNNNNTFRGTQGVNVYKFYNLLTSFLFVSGIVITLFLSLNITASVLIRDIVTPQGRILGCMFYTLVLVLLLDKSPILGTWLPIAESLLLHKLIEVSSKRFYLRYYHFSILMVVFFFLTLSHNTVLFKIQGAVGFNNALVTLPTLSNSQYGSLLWVHDCSLFGYGGNMVHINLPSINIVLDALKDTTGPKSSTKLANTSAYGGYDRVSYLDYSSVKIGSTYILFLLISFIILVSCLWRKKLKQPGY